MRRTHSQPPTHYRTCTRPVSMCDSNSCRSYPTGCCNTQPCSNQSCSNQPCSNQSCSNQPCSNQYNTSSCVVNNRACHTCQYAPYFCINYRRYAIWCDHCKITNAYDPRFLHTHPPCSDVYHNGMYVMPPPAHVVPCLVPPRVVSCTPQHTSSSCPSIYSTDSSTVCSQVPSVCSVDSFFNK